MNAPKYPSKTPALMIQGCTSDAGKSVLAAAVCRILARRGLRVAPFKPQNMALNSAVTVDGGEIGRAQALQALAAGVPPHIDFNPILLKPSTDKRAQVIIHGKAMSDLNARDYHEYKPTAMKAVLESWDRLCAAYDCIVVEGAGSPAEINLRPRDIANMGFAEEVDCPVILIADIDRGGVFAHLVGTLKLLSVTEQARVKGFVINRFRGDIGLLKGGLDWLEAHTGKPVLGVLPYLHGLHLDAEDAIPEQQKSKARFRVVVPVLPHISNHTDFEPLRLHPQIDFRYVRHHEPIPAADLIILPGSKNTGFDLKWLKSQGWEAAIQKHLRYGGKLIGICGGLQMLGTGIYDPHGIEGAESYHQGLGLLELETVLHPQKQLTNRHGTLAFDPNIQLQGYEIHCGISVGKALDQPATYLEGEADGALSKDGQIFASYLHGLFDEPAALTALLTWAGLAVEQTIDINAIREQQLERLADTLERDLQIERILGLMH